MLDDMAYEELPKGGRMKHATTGEQSFTRQVRTYAKMYSITREDIINDDLGAFDALRDVIGRGAAMKMNDVFWTKFLDNATFFTSGNSNYIEGATTNLGTDGVGLSLGVKKFREMRSPSADGQKRIGGPPPTILLVPPELEAVAEALYTARNSAAVKVSEANIHAGKYRPVVVPWLSDTSYTGASSTAWYLFRAPNSAIARLWCRSWMVCKRRRSKRLTRTSINSESSSGATTISAWIDSRRWPASRARAPRSSQTNHLRGLAMARPLYSQA
jgi:hypothetical protein